MSAINITSNIIDSLLVDAHNRESYWHGENHWRGVAQAGWYLAAADPRVDLDVVFLFAVLHDTRRENENKDPMHGHRAAERASHLWYTGQLPISYGRFLVLHEALRIHNGAHPNEVTDPTVAACLDADRLNLWRVGKAPRPDLMCTATGRNQTTIQWAKRLCAGYCSYDRKAPKVRQLSWAQLCQAYLALAARRASGAPALRVVVATPHLRDVALQLDDLMSRPLRRAEQKMLDFGRNYGRSTSPRVDAMEAELQDLWSDLADEEVRKFLR